MLEVELRTILDSARYQELLSFFQKEAIFLFEDAQETHYFSGIQDLRIQKNNFLAKIVLKKGEIHDTVKEELEVKMPLENFDSLVILFQSLGYTTKVKWLRKRYQFEWQGITVTLDYTKGYGYILELEKMVEDTAKNQALQELTEKLAILNLIPTPKADFDAKYNHYVANWEQLIQVE